MPAEEQPRCRIVDAQILNNRYHQHTRDQFIRCLPDVGALAVT